MCICPYVSFMDPEAIQGKGIQIAPEHFQKDSNDLILMITQILRAGFRTRFGWF